MTHSSIINGVALFCLFLVAGAHGLMSLVVLVLSAVAIFHFGGQGLLVLLAATVYRGSTFMLITYVRNQRNYWTGPATLKYKSITAALTLVGLAIKNLSGGIGIWGILCTVCVLVALAYIPLSKGRKRRLNEQPLPVPTAEKEMERMRQMVRNNPVVQEPSLQTN